LDLQGIHWVIVGGESGSAHRPMDLRWARDLRDQCRVAGVPFFFKQVGGRTPKAGGCTLDGREWREYPEWESTDSATASHEGELVLGVPQDLIPVAQS
jgi:protein gp37